MGKPTWSLIGRSLLHEPVHPSSTKHWELSEKLPGSLLHKPVLPWSTKYWEPASRIQHLQRPENPLHASIVYKVSTGSLLHKPMHPSIVFTYLPTYCVLCTVAYDNAREPHLSPLAPRPSPRIPSQSGGLHHTRRMFCSSLSPPKCGKVWRD
ncbi:hypothetical protein PMIN06_010014 [Paraphaeosphaeria minitans]